MSISVSLRVCRSRERSVAGSNPPAQRLLRRLRLLAMTQIKKSQGFTVIELLVVMAIMGLLLASFPFAINAFAESRAVDTAVQATVQSLRRAQTLAQSIEGDVTWGAFVQTGSVTLFQGASYATRTTAFDEVLEFSDSVGVSGVTEVVFSKLAGEPSTTGVTTFETDATTVTLTINAKGAVSYE